MDNNITYIKQILNDETGEKHFSFEVLPPLKGSGTASLFRNIDQLKEFNPSFINITTHHSEFVYHEREDGLLERRAYVVGRGQWLSQLLFSRGMAFLSSLM